MDAKTRRVQIVTRGAPRTLGDQLPCLRGVVRSDMDEWMSRSFLTPLAPAPRCRASRQTLHGTLLTEQPWFCLCTFPIRGAAAGTSEEEIGRDLHTQLLCLCCHGKLNLAIHLLSSMDQHECNSLLGDHLVVALAKRGCLHDAIRVFFALSHRSVFCWTILISCHVKHGRNDVALRLYQCMRRSGIQPNHYTFVSLLKACGNISELEFGEKLHDEVKDMGLLSNIFISNTLISMYGKCGNISKAESIFVHGMLKQDAASWNVMLSAYVEQGEGTKTLLLYRQMREEGVIPDERTLVILLQACIELNTNAGCDVEWQVNQLMLSDFAGALHAEARRRGILFCDFVVTALITVYGKCGNSAKAEYVFSGLVCLDVIKWNSILSAYIDCGHCEKVLQAYTVILKHVSPDQHTFVITLQASSILVDNCSSSLSKFFLLQIAESLFQDACRLGFSSNNFVGNTLIRLYGKCGNIMKAEKLFQGMCCRKDVSWNAMLSAYVEQGKGDKALQLFSAMEKEEVCPNPVTYVIMIQACSALLNMTFCEDKFIVSQCLEICQILHIDIHKRGLGSSVIIGSALVHMYGKARMVLEAETVFGKLTRRNVVSWNAMISAYVEHGLVGEGFELFERMLTENVCMDYVTFVSVLRASSLICSIDTCQKIHFFLTSACSDVMPLLLTRLVHTYGDCAMVADADAVFHGTPVADDVLWSAYLDTFVHVGDCLMSIQTLSSMDISTSKVDDVIFLSVLSACSHAGFIEIGIKCFESMTKNYGMQADLKHYAIMVDLLGRAGAFSRVEKLLERMPILPDVSIWLSLLGVCHIHRNVTMGKVAFDQVIRLKPNEVNPYIIMSNIYADAGMTEMATKISLTAAEKDIHRIVFLELYG